MSTEPMQAFRVVVMIAGESKIYEVQNSSREQCIEDFNKAFKEFKPLIVSVRKCSGMEFIKQKRQ